MGCLSTLASDPQRHSRLSMKAALTNQEQSGKWSQQAQQWGHYFRIWRGSLLLLLTEQQRREIRLCSFLETCLKSTSKGALFLYYSASTTKPSKAGIDITGVWKMGEGYRGQISTSVEGKKQLIIRTAQQWTGWHICWSVTGRRWRGPFKEDGGGKWVGEG